MYQPIFGEFFWLLICCRMFQVIEGFVPLFKAWNNEQNEKSMRDKCRGIEGTITIKKVSRLILKIWGAAAISSRRYLVTAQSSVFAYPPPLSFRLQSRNNDLAV